MAKGLSFKALLQLETKQFQAGLNKVKKQISGFGNFVKSAFAVGSITAFGKQMVNVSKDFEDAMARVKAITNASKDEFNMMTKEAKKLGETTKYTAQEVANSLENLTRNGMSAADATKSVSSVLQLAQANAIGLAEAANIVTNALNMFGLSAKDSQRVNDVLSSTAANAATNISELYEALINAAPAANVLGFSIEETSAAIGALAQRGVKGADAGTQLRMSLTKMADPKIIAKMQEMGVAIDEQTMREEGLIKTVKKLKDAQLGLSDLVEIFSQKGAMGMQQLISSYEDFNKLLKITQNSAGTTARMFQQGIGTTRKELETLKSAYEGFLISLGDKTSGIVNSVVRLLQNLIGNFKTLGGTLSNIAIVIIPLLTRAFVKMGATAAGVIAGIKTAMGGWVTLLTTAVTLVGAGLVGAWNKANQEMREAKKSMSEAASAGAHLQSSVHNLLEELRPQQDKETLAGIVNQLIKMFPQFTTEIKNAADEAGKTGNWEKFKSLLEDIAELQSQVLSKNANEQMKAAAGTKIGQNLKKGGQLSKTIVLDDSDLDNVKTKIIKSDSFSSVLNRAIKRVWGDSADSMKDIVFDTIGKMIAETGGDLSKAGRNINTYLKGIGINMNGEPFYIPTPDGRGKQTVYDKSEDLSMIFSENEVNGFNLLGLSKGDKELLAQVKKADSNIKEIDKNVSELTKSTPQTGITEDTTVLPTGNTSTANTDSDKIKTLLTDYDKTVKGLNNRLAEGTISQSEYEDELSDITKRTWESITTFDNFRKTLMDLGNDLFELSKGLEVDYAFDKANTDYTKASKQSAELDKWLPELKKRDSSFDYKYTSDELSSNIIKDNLSIQLEYAASIQSMIDNLKKAMADGDFDLVKQDAVNRLKVLEYVFGEVKKNADDIQHILNFSEAQKQVKELKEELAKTTFENFTSMASAFDRLTSSLFAIAEVFNEDIKDSEFYKGFQKFTTVINGVIQALESFNTVLNTIKTAQEMYAALQEKNIILSEAQAVAENSLGTAALGAAAEKTTAAGLEVGANATVAASEGAVAEAAGAAAVTQSASAVAGIPILGPAMAIAAIAAIAGMLFSTIGKFAEGGMVGGNSKHGDKLLARVNSGEGILTADGINNLGTLYNNQNKGINGDVQFKIRGTDLIGVINNYHSKMKG